MKRSSIRNMNTKKSKRSCLSKIGFVALIVIIPVMILLGLVGVALLSEELRNPTDGYPRVRSIYSLVGDTRSLTKKIRDWLPKSQLDKSHVDTHVDSPDWSLEHWTPIRIQIDSDPTVTLCKLNFQKYSDSPHDYPMFKVLVANSNCFKDNIRTEKLSTLKVKLEQHYKMKNLPIKDPAGFIFHESRVGSTLVANMLASDPWSMVFSESDPPAAVLLHCNTCSKGRQMTIFRDILRIMGMSPVHKRYFFKFQSISTTKMLIALEAFPTVPWAFLYRNPVQTMMSHLDPSKKVEGAPCLRSKRSQPESVMQTLSKYSSRSGKDLPDDAWCAAHLNMICESAIAAFETFSLAHITNTTDTGAIDNNLYSITTPLIYGDNAKIRGIVLNYESLPGVIATTILPRLFDVPVSSVWIQKMRSEAAVYSKGGNGKKNRVKNIQGLFRGDSVDKENRATKDILKWSEDILNPSYASLEKYAMERMKLLAPDTYELTRKDGFVNWTYISAIPNIQSDGDNGNVGGGRSRSGSSSSGSRSGMAHGNGNGNVVDILRSSDFTPWNPFSSNHSSIPFERVRCPPIPDLNYPKAYPVMDLIKNWSPDDTDIPRMHFDSLCHFDYQTEYEAAVTYRESEKPFVMYNMPELNSAVEKWSNLDYLQQRLGKKTYRTEISKDNHFMYFRTVKNAYERFKDRHGNPWTDPTEVQHMTFEDFVKLAITGQNKTLADRKHAYFRVTTMGTEDKENTWLFEDLPFFRPKKSIIMVEPKEQRGVHCRFGMRAVIAETHYDGSRNAVAMLGGLRRWVMAHPDQCKSMYLLPRQHPSGRHSEVDWSKPDLNKYPNFVNTLANEVILKPGDMLYVPTAWFHYIVSLNLNYQCNTRSGKSRHYDKALRACGF